MKSVIALISGGLLTVVTYFFGGFDFCFQSLLVMMVLDYITGICKAILKKKLNCTVGVRGMIKKVGYLVIVALAVLLDRIIQDGTTIRCLVIYSFIVNEGISILENWGAMGLKLPSIIETTLEKLNTLDQK